MQKSFLSFLDEIGFTGLRRLSAKSDIHLCRERATGRLMVAKLWPEDLSKCAEREVRALAALGEIDLAPRLGAVLHSPFGTCALRPFVSGQTLYEIQHERSVTGQVVLQLRELIQAIHNQGWVHRDLTPNNVVLAEGGVQLLDWDLAEEISRQGTDSFSPRGTPGYSVSQTAKDLLQQDVEAVQRIAEFLEGATTQLAAPNHVSQNPRSRSWWTELFSARP